MIEEGEPFRIGDLVQVLYVSRFVGRYGSIARVDTESRDWIVVEFPGGEVEKFSPLQLRIIEDPIVALAELYDGR